MTHNDIVQKLWNLCDVLRDDGINYSDYVTELVLLLFIKMEHEAVQAETPFEHKLPLGYRWIDIKDLMGINLLDHYKKILLVLSTGKMTTLDPDHPNQMIEKVIVTDPLILAIYADAQTRLREPRHLEQMIKTLDSIDWFDAQRDGLGDLYEGLLEKNANETKSGAGQYFTPRPLIDSIVRCIKPKKGETIQDPAAGTAGFLIAADRYIKQNTDELFDLKEAERNFQITKAFIGVELVPSTRRLALMNCLLHAIEGEHEGAVILGNTLGQTGANLPKVDIVLANPPFGTAKGGDASITRSDLTFDTSNKQLAFLQHIYRGLKPGGRAAVVLPDNVLFEAGIGTDIRRDLMDKCNLHTILRLPTGIFYAQGVKTNVLFFTKGTAKNPQQIENCTDQVWVYDLRANMPTFGKRTPFGQTHLTPFEGVYDAQKRTEGEWSFTDPDTEKTLENSRWRCFSRDYIRNEKGDSLDLSWIKDDQNTDSVNLSDPHVLALNAMTELASAMGELNQLMTSLGSGLDDDQKAILKDLLKAGE